MDNRNEREEIANSDDWKSINEQGDLTWEAEQFFAGGEEPPNPRKSLGSTESNKLITPIRLGGCKPGGKGRRLVKRGPRTRKEFTSAQRLLILDTWKRSGLSAGEFAPLVGVAKNTLYQWKGSFERHGPEGLSYSKRGAPRGSTLPEVTKRTILMIKESNADYGCQRISDMLFRGPGLAASPGAVGRVLKEAGYELEEMETRPHKPKEHRFERSKPNQMWQTDLFTFILRRQNRRVYLVAFMDDHSRFIVGFGLYASAPSALVIETLRSAIASYGQPEEVLTDNGPQYVTWRGKSAFAKELEKRGIKHLVARPKHPQTLGKVERMWGSLWRECVEKSVFLDLTDARERVALYFDHYNFHRTHQGIDGLVPADRFFGAAPEVLETLKKRVAANALELAKNGVPKKPFYLTGKIGDKSFAVHAAGDRVYMTSDKKGKEEVAMSTEQSEDIESSEPRPEPVTPSAAIGADDQTGTEQPAPPGTSPLDEGLAQIAQSLSESEQDTTEGHTGGER
jgi:transposase InsO family protein